MEGIIEWIVWGAVAILKWIGWLAVFLLASVPVIVWQAWDDRKAKQKGNAEKRKGRIQKWREQINRVRISDITNVRVHNLLVSLIEVGKTTHTVLMILCVVFIFGGYIWIACWVVPQVIYGLLAEGLIGTAWEGTVAILKALGWLFVTYLVVGATVAGCWETWEE